MRIIRGVVFFIANILIFIGNIVIFVCLLPVKAVIFLFHPFFFLFRKKKATHRSLTPLPIRVKLWYFSLGGIFCFIFICIPLVILTVTQTLPNPSQLSQSALPQTTKIYDRHGVLLYQIYANQNRTTVSLSDIPLYVQQATIAIEDKNFYKNPGFDIPAMVRAAIADLSHKNIQGGSTITQQLIKSSLLSPEQTITRKFQEIILAFWTEKLYSKQQILSMYFNQIPYGGTAYGIESAAQVYFGKHIKDVDLAEGAFLAGLPQAPTTYSPFGQHPTLWKNRQEEVLLRMQQLGYITKTQEKAASEEQLHFQTPETPLLAPHFVMYVRDLLEKKYGLPLVEKGGLKVITSLDMHTQDMAQQVVSSEVNKDGYLNLTNGATVVTNPSNGDILAMVGSANYDNPIDGNFNVTTALRQPGSSIKIVTYSAALMNGFTAATILDDSPVTYTDQWGNSYSPVNYDGRFHGRVTLRTAFANSFNIPAVKTLNTVGVPTFVDLGRKMGLSHLQDANKYGLAATLGGVDATMLDMATVYGTIANSGNRMDLNPILKVTDSKGNILEEKMHPTGVQVVDKGIAFIISNILADNQARAIEFGTNSPLYIPNYTISVKTGTTDEKRDNWTIGYTPHRLVAVWVGNNDNSPMSQALASGITGAAPIWHGIMTNLLKGQPNEQITQPDDVIQKDCFGRKEYFIIGTENTAACALPSLTPQPSTAATPLPFIQITTSPNATIHITVNH